MPKSLRIKPQKPGESHANYAYRNLRGNIMEFVLLPGEQLDEQELSEALEISRTPVHEAMLRLREERLVNIVPRRESRVAYIDLSLVTEGAFMRYAVEPVLIKSIAGSLPAEDLEKLLENLDTQRKILEENVELYRFYPVDDAFHELIYRAANKKEVFQAVKKVVSHLDRMRYLVRFEGGFEIEAMSFQEHKMILNMLTFGITPEMDLAAFYKQHVLRFQLGAHDLVEKYSSYFGR